MSKNSKKNRHVKNLENVMNESYEGDVKSVSKSDLETEEAIKKQFLLIQRDYKKLVQDITKEYGLVKTWLGHQAAEKKEMIRDSWM